MCVTCGCDKDAVATITDPATGASRPVNGKGDHDDEHDSGHGHWHTHADGTHHRHAHDADGHHHHGHDHNHHGHGPDHDHPPVVTLERAVLAENDRCAARNRGWLEGRGVLAINLVSSPGAGKTTLLERTVRDCAGFSEIVVIEGDQMTTADADRVRAAGARALQINTGAGCHLEAGMVGDAIATLDPPPGALLLIENVGNLVCPAMFDLGEHMKAVVISVTEGEDKPLKYPFMFRAAELVVVNKIDLAPYVGFDRDALLANIRSVNPRARVVELSARTGEGLDAWFGLLARLRGTPPASQPPRRPLESPAAPTG